jgi:hypothetical protein
MPKGNRIRSVSSNTGRYISCELIGVNKNGVLVNNEVHFKEVVNGDASDERNIAMKET